MLIRSFRTSVPQSQVIRLPQALQREMEEPVLATPRWRFGIDLLMGPLAKRLLEQMDETRRTRQDLRPLVDSFREQCSLVSRVDEAHIRLQLPNELTLSGRHLLQVMHRRVRIIDRRIWREILNKRAKDWQREAAEIALDGMPYHQLRHQPSSEDWALMQSLQSKLRTPVLDGVDPLELERIVGEMLDLTGVGVVEQTPTGGDGGRDLVVYIPRENGRLLLQVECKHHRNNVGIEIVHRLVGATASSGSFRLLVATSNPSRGAREELNEIEDLSFANASKLILWFEEDPLNLGFSASIRQMAARAGEATGSGSH